MSKFLSAVEATGFKYNSIPECFTDANLPPLLNGSGEVAVTLHRHNKKEAISTLEWQAMATSEGRKFAHPLAVLARNCSETKRRSATMFTVWNDTRGQTWCLILNDGPEGMNHHDVRVYPIEEPSDVEWPASCEAAYEAN